jgi:WD40 repeat protein
MRVGCWLISLSLVLLFDQRAGAADLPPQQPKLDSHGDPLPDGALLRIGTVRLHPGAVVEALAFTNDGKCLVTANRATGVHTWDVATGRLVREFVPQGNPWTLALAPDGRMVAVVDKDKVCSVWDVADGKGLHSFKPAWDNVPHVQFSPDAKTLAITNWRRQVQLWDIASAKLLNTCEGDPYPSGSVGVAFSPDGKCIASRSNTGPLVLTSLASGTELRRFGAAQGPRYTSLVFSPDSKWLASLWDDHQRVDVWDAATGKLQYSLRALQSTRGDFLSMTFSADSKLLITGHRAWCDISLWDAGTGKFQRRMENAHQGAVCGLAASADGKWLASSSHDCTLRVWDLATTKPLHSFKGHQTSCVMPRFLPDGKTLISTCGPDIQPWTPDGFAIRFWDQAGEELKRIEWDGVRGQRALLSCDGRTLVVADPDGKVTARDLSANKERLLFEDSQHPLDLLAWSRDGNVLLWANRSEFRLRNLKTGITVAALARSQPDVRYETCALSADGSTLMLRASGVYHSNAVVTVWDVQGGRRDRRAPLLIGDYFRGTMAPSGRLVAGLTVDGSDVWETRTGQSTGRGSDDGILGRPASFSADERLLATTTNSQVFLWDVATGTLLTRLVGHRGRIASIDFSPDGKRLVSGGDDTTILVWDIEPHVANLGHSKRALPARELESLWRELASTDAPRAYAAIARLVQAPQSTASMLKQKLAPVKPEEIAQVRAKIDELESDKFKLREAAMMELANLREFAEVQLERVLAGSPTLEMRYRVEVLLQKLAKLSPSPQRLQQERALLVLQWLRTAEAKRLLEALAQGAPEAWVTQQAEAACRRLVQ